jgi:hypothetical protein
MPLPTLLERGLHMAAGDMPRAAGVTAIYRRGESRVVVRAVMRQPECPIVTTDDFMITWLDQDWMIAADELIVGGSLIQPQRGDKIETTTGITYEVLPRGQQACFKPIGMPIVMYRISTRKTP